MRYLQRTVYPRSSKQPKTRGRNHVKVLRSETVCKPSRPLIDRSPVVREKRWKNVADVVEKANKTYSLQLTFALNSISEVRNCPFLRPKEVWQALEWLATTYYEARVGQTGEPDFDRSIRTSCGWRYAPHQSKATVARNRKAYTTGVDYKEYTIEEHIGTNRSGDPQHTIRIAFGWDAEIEKVVVGYLGLHQPTQRS